MNDCIERVSALAQERVLCEFATAGIQITPARVQIAVQRLVQRYIAFLQRHPADCDTTLYHWIALEVLDELKGI